MTFAQVARQVIEYRKTNKQSVTVGLFMAARGYWLLNGGGVRANRGVFSFGRDSDLLEEVTQSGFNVLLPQFVGDKPGSYDAISAPSVLASDFLINDLSAVVPRNHINFINQLLALYEKRIFDKSILSAQEEFGVAQLLAAGFPVLLESSETRSEEHNAAAGAFLEAERAYVNRNVAQGADALLRSRENVAFWGKIYAVTEAIATGPDKIIKAGLKFAGLNPAVLFVGGAALLLAVFGLGGKK